LIPQPQLLASAVLSEWLHLGGIRGYEVDLAALTGPESI